MRTKKEIEKSRGRALWRQRARIASQIVLFLYWLLLIFATHYPHPEQITPQTSDKLLHFGAYGVLAGLVGMVWSFDRPWNLKVFVVLALALSLHGVLDELFQIPVGRHADVMDWIADTVGAVGGLLAIWGVVTLQRFVGRANSS